MPMLRSVQVWPPKLNQKPQAMPRPWFSPERRLHMRMVLRRLERRADADRAVDRTVGRSRAFACGVLDAEVDRIHADLLGQFVDHALHREGRHRRRRRAIGRGLRPVDQNFVADRLDVLEVVAGERGHGAEFGPHAGIGAAGIAQRGVGRGDRAVLAGADLDVDRGGAGRSRGAEHLVARHHQLDRPARLARQRQRDRLGPDMGLAAEAAADLRRGDAQLRRIHAQAAARSAGGRRNGPACRPRARRCRRS